MSKFQLLSAFINLGGDRDNVVHRIPEDPITYPEMLVLRVVHGGEDHVHGLVDVGDVETPDNVERERLTNKYGAVVNTVFPGAIPNLPAGDTSIPTLDEVKAGKAAADAAMASTRAKGAGRVKKDAAVPDLTT